jgi:hypothetical protein
MACSKKLRYLEDNRIVFIDDKDSLLSSIAKVLKENAFQARENDWTEDKMDERSRYDAYKIMKTVEDFLR